MSLYVCAFDCLVQSLLIALSSLLIIINLLSFLPYFLFHLPGADFAKSNGPFLSTRIDNVDKQIMEINAKFGSNNTYSSDPGYEMRMKHIESELSSLQEYLSNNGMGGKHDLSVDVERRSNDNRSNSNYRSSDASTYNDYDAYNGIYSNDSNKGRSYGDSSGGRGGMQSEYNDYEEYHNPLLSSRSVNNKSSGGSNINIRRFSAPGDFVCSGRDSEKSINKPYVGARTAANPSDIGGRNVAKKSTNKAGVKQGVLSTRPAGAGAGARKRDVSILSFTNPLSPVRSTLVTASANASRRSSGSAGSPSRDSPTRSESINNLIAKFSSGSTPPRSMSNSFIGELINNVHSDIYPYPSLMREEGQSSEEDSSRPHTTCNLNRSGLGSLRVREAGSNSTDIRGFESFRVDGEVEDSEDEVSSKRRTSDGYIGKRIPATVPEVATSNTKEVKEDSEVDFDYSHIHDKDPFDSIPNTKRTSLGSRSSTSGKHSDENNMLGDKASRDEEAFRNKIFDQNEGDFDCAFTETNPMKRKTVKNAAVTRVIMNPSKKIILKSSVMSVMANTKKPVPPYLSEKTDSADSIPDISENDDVRLSPFTVIDERDSPGEKSLNSVYTAGDGNSPISDFEKTSEQNDRFLSRCDSIPLPRPLLYSTMDAFSPDISQVREHLRSSAEGEYHGSPARIMESRTKKPNGGLKKVEEQSADYVHTYADNANTNESGGNYAAFVTNPLRRANSDAGNIPIIKPVRINESDIKKALSSSTMSSDSNTKYASFVSAPSKGTDSSEQHTIALNPSTPTEGATGAGGGGEGGDEECDVSKSNSSSLSRSPESASKYSAFLSALTNSVEDDKTQSSVATSAPAPVPLPAPVSTLAPVLSTVPAPGNKAEAVIKSAAVACATWSHEVIGYSKHASAASVSNSKQTSPVSVSTTNSDTNAKYAAFVNGPIKNTDSNIKISEITKEITIMKQSSIIVTSNNMEVTPEVATRKEDDLMPTTLWPVASKENSMSTLDSLNEDIDDAQPQSVEEKIKLFTKPSDSPTESRLIGGGRYDQRKAYSDDAIVFLGDPVTARPRSLRHISEITTGLPPDGNKINWNDLKQNLRRTDSGRNQGNPGGTSTPPVLSFAMTDFNSSDESGSDDENGGMSPSLAMLRSSDSSIIPRNHREINSGASSHSTSYSNLYGTEVPRPTSVGYSKSYSTSEDVERKHQDLLAAEKIPPYPGMFLSKSRNNSESRLSVCSDRSDGHGTNQGQRGGIATTAAADYIENDTQPRTGSVRLLTENIFSEKNIKSAMGLTGNEMKVDGVNVGAEVKRRQSAPSAGLSKVTGIDIALAKSILERDAKDDESASLASSVGRGKDGGGSVDSIPARGLKSKSELTPRGIPSSISALPQHTANSAAPSSTSDTSRTPEAPSLITGDVIQASPGREKGVSAGDKKAEEVIEIKNAETAVTPTKEKEDDISPAKPKEFSPTVLRPLTSKSDAQSRSQKSVKERSTKSSENAMPTPPLSVSPTPNDIKTGSASLMTYFTATERAKTPTQSQELAARPEKEKENISRRRSVTGGTADLTPGNYYEPPNVKPPADKTMEKSIALMISKAAENESRSESEYEAMSPKSSANAKKDTESDPKAAKALTPLKSDVTALPGNGNGSSDSSSKKDKAVVMQTAGDADPGPNDVIPALTFLSPDNVMAPLSTRYIQNTPQILIYNILLPSPFCSVSLLLGEGFHVYFLSLKCQLAQQLIVTSHPHLLNFYHQGKTEAEARLAEEAAGGQGERRLNEK